MLKNVTTWKVSKFGVFSGPYFPAFGLNTEIYGVNLHIQSEYRKIRIRKNSEFGHFSRIVYSTACANMHQDFKIYVDEMVWKINILISQERDMTLPQKNLFLKLSLKNYILKSYHF